MNQHYADGLPTDTAWNLEINKYSLLHDFLIKINYEPYIDHIKISK